MLQIPEMILSFQVCLNNVLVNSRFPTQGTAIFSVLGREKRDQAGPLSAIFPIGFVVRIGRFSRNKSQIKPESLILAQNERWRQA